jgi:SAM-dependent methyltransferase
MGPLEWITEEVLRFVEGAVPPGARVLEVGCGRGALAAKLLARGWALTAIDRSPEAVQAAQGLGVPAAEADFLAYRGGPFDAVLFTRSLHHIHPLEGAVDQARHLLAPGGLLVLDEFAWDAVDRTTAAWFYDTMALLDAAEVLGQPWDHAVDGACPLERWRHAHAHDEPLHGGERMLEAIAGCFEYQRVDWTPCLYRRAADRLDPGARGGAIVARLHAIEALRIGQGVLKPAGLRVVARLR